MTTPITLAANQGQIAGGEVMLLRTAGVLRSLGYAVHVVAPASPDEVISSARAAGFDTTAISSTNRVDYCRGLRRWDRRRTGVLWCHGLLPSVATAGHRSRIVHLHQLPTGPLQRVLYLLCRAWALTVLVPSRFVSGRLPRTRVLHNWTNEVVTTPRERSARATVGFIGRLAVDKGAEVLARALSGLPDAVGGSWSVVLAGDARFVSDEHASSVEQALSSLGSRVNRLGWVEREVFFSAVDIAVVPSLSPEAFGLTALEAMAAQVPVIVSDAGALPEVVGPDHPWIVPAGDAAALTRMLIEVLAGERDEVVEQSYDRWKREFSPDAARRSVADLLTDLGFPPEVAHPDQSEPST